MVEAEEVIKERVMKELHSCIKYFYTIPIKLRAIHSVVSTKCLFSNARQVALQTLLAN